MAYVDRDNQTPARKKEIKKCYENGTETMKMNRLELLELTEGKIKEAREIAANGGEGMFSSCKVRNWQHWWHSYWEEEKVYEELQGKFDQTNF